MSRAQLSIAAVSLYGGVPMKYRRKSMSGNQAKRVFRGSVGVHPRNFAPMPMRGGIRA